MLIVYNYTLLENISDDAILLENISDDATLLENISDDAIETSPDILLPQPQQPIVSNIHQKCRKKNKKKRREHLIIIFSK